MLPTLTTFSAGYHLLQDVMVEPSDDDHPRINDHLYASLQNQSYGDVGTPILFRYPGGQSHFSVEPTGGISVDTMQLPQDMIDEYTIGPAPASEDFMVAKPRHAVRIFRLATLGQAFIE